MGLVHADLALKNPRTGAEMNVRAMVDSGSLLLCIPQHVALQLQLEELEKREVTLADGNRHLVPYVGPLQVQFANRRCYTGALVLGDEALLGSVPMEDLDVLIDMARQRLIVNPESPNIAVAPVKSYKNSGETNAVKQTGLRHCRSVKGYFCGRLGGGLCPKDTDKAVLTVVQQLSRRGYIYVISTR